MPELPEVEVLVRHLAPSLRHRRVRWVVVNRPRVLRPMSVATLRRRLVGRTFLEARRRGKYVLFTLRGGRQDGPVRLLGHLGMTGRMYLQPATAPLPRHAAVVLGLGRRLFVFEDTRYFGRLTLDLKPVATLGPEPLEPAFTTNALAATLRRSRQPIKVKLLDQSVVAGLGNIYASEALFRARLAPQRPARDLTRPEMTRLRRAIRQVLTEAIRWGSTVPLDWAGTGAREGLFYYGRAAGTTDYYEERLRVYDRAGRPCLRCRAPIRRIAQAGRSTYYCPRCQR
jgi:formamidopyrimidine-DNA glycosylase